MRSSPRTTLPSFDEPHILSRHASRVTLETCPFVNEYMKPQRLVDNMYCFLMKTSAHLAWLVFARNERQGIITDREVVLTRLLLPHIRRAVTISNMLDARAIGQSRMVELDALRCAVVLTDASGTILHANRSAEHMLRNGGPIRDVGGILQATALSPAAELRAAIGLAAGHEVEIGKTGLAIALTEPGAPTSIVPTSFR
jgi:PAS domain-containing protein